MCWSRAGRKKIYRSSYGLVHGRVARSSVPATQGVASKSVILAADTTHKMQHTICKHNRQHTMCLQHFGRGIRCLHVFLGRVVLVVIKSKALHAFDACHSGTGRFVGIGWHGRGLSASCLA